MLKKTTKRKNEIPITTKNIVGIGVSSLVGLIIVVILTLFASAIISKSAVMTSSIGAYFIGCVMIGGIVVGFSASKMCEFKGIVSGVISSIPYSFGVTILMLIFSHGQLSSKTILLFIGIIICSTIGGIVSANTKRRK